MLLPGKYEQNILGFLMIVRFKTLGSKADSVVEENEKHFSFTYTHIVFSNPTKGLFI